MRPPRLQDRDVRALPLSFSYEPHYRSRTVDLVITAPEQFVTALLQSFAVLSYVADEAKRTIEAGHRDLHIRDQLERIDVEDAQIRAAYRFIRSCGVKHRAAIHQLVTQHRHKQNGLWTYARINAVVKSKPRFPKPALHAVPKTKPTKGAAS